MAKTWAKTHETNTTEAIRRASRSALMICALMLGVSALAGCKGGGGGTRPDPTSTSPAAKTGNSPPQITGTAPTTAKPGEIYRFKPDATDPDGDPVSFQIQNKPAWATFNTVTGELTGTPTEGTFANIIISASDGRATSALPPFSIRVGDAAIAAGGASASLSWIAPTMNVDGSALTDLAGFVISYGTSATALSQSISIDNPSVDRYVVEGLETGKTYYFGVRAVASSGAESDLSEVVSKAM